MNNFNSQSSLFKSFDSPFNNLQSPGQICKRLLKPGEFRTLISLLIQSRISLTIKLSTKIFKLQHVILMENI